MEYLLKSILCLLLLLLFYRLFLQQEVLYRFNRFYLLFAVLISFLLPLNQIEIPDSTPSEWVVLEEQDGMSVNSQGDFQQNFEKSESPNSPLQFSWKYLGIGLYGLVSLIFAYRFFWNFRVLKTKANSNIRIIYRDQVLVLLEEDTLPYSFLNFIFVHKKSFEAEGLSDAIFEHERCHVREKHSLDLIFIEFLMIPFWFHPGLYWAKQSIQLNHEFIADQAAIQKVDQISYQRQLLSLAISSTQHSLTSRLNFSLTKKRMQMMSKEQKPIRTALKLLFLIPMMGLIYYGFSEHVKKPIDVPRHEVHIFPTEVESSENLYDLTFYLATEGRFILNDPQSNEVQPIAKLSTVLDQLPDKELLIRMIIHEGNSMGEIDAVKKIFREHDIRRLVWIDGEGVSQLEENLSQSYQLVYQKPLQQMTKAEYYSQTKFILKYLDGELEEVSYEELPQNLKDGLPDTPSKIEPKGPSAELYESWKNGQKFALWLDGEVIPNSKLDEISQEEIVHFFSSFVHLNARSERFPQNYQVNLYTKEAFENNFGEFSDPRTKPLRGTVTIPVDEPKNQSFSTNTNPVSLYQKELKAYHERLNTGVHFIEKDKRDQEELMEEFLDLGGKYFRLRVEDKRLTERPTHPFSPYIRLKKEDGYYFKLREDLTEEELKQLPPPPPPANGLKSTASTQITSGLLETYQKMLLAYDLKKYEMGLQFSGNSAKREAIFEEFIRVQNVFLALGDAEKKLVNPPTSPSMPSRTKSGSDIC
ncbi:hypothetical protein KUV23_15750 [Algoriphagus marincola]|uniref:Peptidase M56 domain-containing protein n=1 Tax=Algoriphagus marincola TaxID=264027 RepID=A0ABS7N7Y4_9BACT|nr:M56 family metallopeptidase [Algoriphagus marincola]MBY5952442.1 hypothetical protein [Algoriphagus marincola]